MRTGFEAKVLHYAKYLERAMAVAILAAVTVSAAVLLAESAVHFIRAPGDTQIDSFLSRALLIVMGVEFVRMLVLHTPRAVMDVLLFAIARQMTVSHAGAVETLLGVAAVAGIFAVKRFLFPAARGRNKEPV